MTNTVEVIFVVVGDIQSNDSKHSVITELPLHCHKLNQLNPFQGVFHYRLKVQGKHLPRSLNIDEQGFVWKDISGRNSYEEIDTHSEAIVEIQLLLLQVPSIGYDIHHRYDSVDHYLHMGHDHEGIDEDEDEALLERQYMEELNYRIPGPTDRVDTSGITYNGAIDCTRSSSSSFSSSSKGLKSSLRHAHTAAAAVSTINLSNVMSNASMVWSKVKATAATIQQETKILLTDTSSSIFQAHNDDDNDDNSSSTEIDQLHGDLSSTFIEGKTTHIQLLFDLWEIQVLPIRSMPYERVSAGWKAAGWQKEDPVMELKSTGLLALLSMVYIGEHYKERNLHMLRSNEISKPTHYPYAIVGVNITLMLVELLKLRDLSAKKDSCLSSLLRGGSNVFYEIFSSCLFHIDRTWTDSKATRTDFSRIVNELKAIVTAVLRRGPSSLAHFRGMASEEGMLS